MLNKAILSLSAAVTVGYAASPVFTSTSKAVNHTNNIYAAAGALMSADPAVVASAEARMYAEAANLQPLANRIENSKF